MVVATFAFIQWPLYGFLIDRTSHRVWTICGILVMHIGLCYWLFAKGFLEHF
jgi:hypothetical protein